MYILDEKSAQETRAEMLRKAKLEKESDANFIKTWGISKEDFYEQAKKMLNK